MHDPENEFQSLTRPVRQGSIPWSVRGFLKARAVVRRARAGQLRLPADAAGLASDLLDEAELDQVALGLWLRREHRDAPPEVPAAHHLRFHAVEAFLVRNEELLVEEGLLKRGEHGLEPNPLLLAELVSRPFDSPLKGDQAPGFDAREVLKAVARRVR